jgi:hypothetical protein
MQYIKYIIYSVMIKEKEEVVMYCHISPPFYQGLVVTVVLSLELLLLSLLPLYPMVLFGAVIVMLPPR